MSGEIRRVGFIGLGRIGSGIASNILKAGFDLTVYNRTAAKMRPLMETGAKGANSPKEAAATADAVVTCLMDDASMYDIVAGENGLLSGLKPGGIHIGTATISPQCSARMAGLHARHGSHYVAGPVVGRPHTAAEGRMLTYVAGNADVIEKCRPLFGSYARLITVVGEDHRLANYVKLAFNYMVISQIELMGQVYAFAEKSGFDPKLANDLIDRCLGSSAMKQYAKKIVAQDFDPAGFELMAGFKDVSYILNASTEVRAPLNFASAIREKFLAALAHGMERRDWSAIYEITRMQAGLDYCSGE